MTQDSAVAAAAAAFFADGQEKMTSECKKEASSPALKSALEMSCQQNLNFCQCLRSFWPGSGHRITDFQSHFYFALQNFIFLFTFLLLEPCNIANVTLEGQKSEICLKFSRKTLLLSGLENLFSITKCCFFARNSCFLPKEILLHVKIAEKCWPSTSTK